MNKFFIFLALLVAAGAASIFLWSCCDRNLWRNGPRPAEVPPAQTQTPQTAAPAPAARNRMHRITLATSFGDVAFETYDADAPKAVENFIALAKKGFYNGLTFHRIVKGFVIQRGDPKGNGSGGPGYTFEDELNPDTESAKIGYRKGAVAMANSGPDTNGSQFFVTLADLNNRLPHNYTIFGTVVSGQDAVDRMGGVRVDSGDKPIEPVLIKSVTVENTP